MDAVVPGISRSAGEFPVRLELVALAAGRESGPDQVEHLGSLRQEVWCALDEDSVGMRECTNRHPTARREQFVNNSTPNTG
jgi:hypothetical protein